MRRIKPLIGLLSLLSAVILFAAKPYMNIVAASGVSKAETDVYAHKLKRVLANDEVFKKAQRAEGFKVVSRASGKYYIATIEPLYDSGMALSLLDKVQHIFPDAYVFAHRGDEVPEPVPASEPKAEVKTVHVPAESKTKTVYVEKRGAETLSGMVLAGLLLLALIVFVLVIYSLRQKRRIESVSEALKHEHEELESIIERQEDIMVNVGEKIREPAKEISSSSEKIMQTKLDPVQSEELAKIKNSDQLLLEITNDLIDFLNIKSDKVQLHHELFNINNVLDEMAGMVSKRARGSKVEFIFDIEKEVPAKFIGDSLRLGQVLTNLLSNAMKFTNAGEVRLHIRRLEDTGEKVMLQFVISDTGVGIDPARFDDIFEPFASVNDLKETGLGLYISRALIEMMGGAIELKSAVGKGSDFILSIPFDVPDVNEKRHYRLPAKAYTGRKMVLVEVQPTAADALKKMLEYFKNDVSVRSVQALANKSDILFESEVVIVAENAFTPEIKTLIGRLKSETEARVVLAGSMTDMPHDISALAPLIDARIMKPLNLQRVYDLIVDLFEDRIKEVDTVGITPRHTTPTAVKSEHHGEVPETPNVSKKSFADFAGASVLVVEDNLINQKVLLSLFSGSGIDVTVANDGVEALDAVENPDNRFDLVLMDINMPVMDGYEATKHIRSVPEFNDLPIVSLTGLGLPEEIAKMYALGMNAHLTKPVQVGRLYTVFTRFVKPSETVAEAAEETTPSRFENSAVLAAKEGLERASNDAELYGEILEEFVKIYANADQTLGLMMRTDDLEGAKQLCLDIKGVGSNIGAIELASVCEQLYAALSKGEHKELLKLAEAFNVQLQALLKEARKYLP